MNRRDDNNTTDAREEGRQRPQGGKPAANSSRKRRRRPSRIMGIGARMILLSCAILVLLLVAGAIVAKALRPYAQVSDLKAQLSDINRQIAQTDQQNAAYNRRLAYLQTPQGEMAEARNLGYLVHGEVPVVVDGTPGALSETPLAQPRSAPPTFMTRVRNWFRSFNVKR